MKNCDVAECGSPVRAIATVPGTLSSPALLLCSASFGTGARVGFCVKVRGESATLDHEPGDHAMELSAVVLLRLDVGQEVLDGLRRGIGVELDPDFAGAGVEVDLRIGGAGLRSAEKQSGGEQQRGAT